MQDFEQKACLDATFGSIEAINGASFASAKASIVELQEEIQELRAHVQNMTDEKSKVANLLNFSEDKNSQLKDRNSELMKRLEQMKKSLDQALKYQKEVEELQSIALSKEREKDVYQQAVMKNKSRLTEIANENLELQSKLDETMEKLNNAVTELTSIKKAHCLTVERLKEENEEMKSKLNESLVIKVQLEEKIEELKSDVNSMRESQFFQRTPSIFDIGESEFLSPSFDDDPFAGNAKNEENVDEKGPVAISTPFLKRLSKSSGMRGSISDEIKVMGVKEMTPFCEKSAFHDDNIGKTSETGTQTPFLMNKDTVEEDDEYSIIFIQRLSVFAVVILTFFTFFGAIELGDGRKLFPISWVDFLPEPVPFLSVKSANPIVW